MAINMGGSSAVWTPSKPGEHRGPAVRTCSWIYIIMVGIPSRFTFVVSASAMGSTPLMEDVWVEM